MKDSFNISLSSIFCIHRNNTAIGAIIINIHKYIILINARTHKTSISIANTTVVHHWIIVLSIVAFANLSLEVFTLVTTSVFKILNHIKYNGPIENGILETKDDEICTIIFKNGTKYIGEIHNNKITGKGKYIFPSGAFYSGNLLNGFRNGFGKYYSNEISYEGNWKNGLKNGIGKMINKNMIYEGNWINGNINGYFLYIIYNIFNSPI
jgi:hypothetical protein